MNVLLVEDNDISIKLMKIILQQFELTPDIAKDAVSAMDLYFANCYDIVFLDIGLPDIDGIAVAKIMLAYNKYKHTKSDIYALTAHTNNECKQACLACGMTGFIAKPIEIAVIQKIVVTTKNQS